MRLGKLLCAALVATASFAAKAAYEQIDRTIWYYETQGEGVRLTSTNANDTKLIVPRTINGKPLTYIAAGAFNGLPATSIVLPSSVAGIANGAFLNCAKLTSVTLSTDFKGAVTKDSATFQNCNSRLAITFKDVRNDVIEARFDLDGDGVVNDSKWIFKYTVGSKLKILPDVWAWDFPDGLQFSAWYTLPTRGSKVTSSTIIKTDTTYYAHWEPRKYTLEPILYLDGYNDGTMAGSATGRGSYLPGKKVTLKATAKTGYMFLKWRLNFSGSDLFTPSITFEMPGKDIAAEAYFVSRDTVENSINLSVNQKDGSNVYEAFEDYLADGVTGVVGCKTEYVLAPETTLGPQHTVTMKATGLPAGLKLTLDKATGAYIVKGTPTSASKFKNGAYVPSTVKFTVTVNGKFSKVFTTDWTVYPLPSFAVGTFNGGTFGKYANNGYGSPTASTFTISLSSAGKLSGKMTMFESSYTFTASGISDYVLLDENHDGVLEVTAIQIRDIAVKRTSKTMGNGSSTDGVVVITPSDNALFGNNGQLTLDFGVTAYGGVSEQWEGMFYGSQNVWTKNAAAKALAKVLQGQTQGWGDGGDGFDAVFSVKMKANGVAAITVDSNMGKFSASSTVLLPDGYYNVYIPPKNISKNVQFLGFYGSGAFYVEYE